MSEKLLDIVERRTITSLRYAAHDLFKDIAGKFGIEIARQIFREVSFPLSDDEARELKNLEILRRFRAMEKPNRAELARQLVAENEESCRRGEPAPNGPRGTTNLMTMDKHIRNLLKEQEHGIAAGTWISMGKFSWPKDRLHLLMRALD